MNPSCPSIWPSGPRPAAPRHVPQLGRRGAPKPPAGQGELQLGPVAFKGTKDRCQTLEQFRRKSKRELIESLERGGRREAVAFMVEAGHLIPGEALDDMNALTVFRSVQERPGPKESDADWWTRVQEAVAKDTRGIKNQFDEFLSRRQAA